MTHNNKSFLPEDYLEKRIARRTNAICLTLFAVVMAGVLAAFFVTDRQRNEVRDLQTQVNAQFEEAARHLEQLDELRIRKKQMIQKAKITSVLIERIPRSLLLAELINNMPSSLSLIELELNTKTLRTRPRPRTAMEREAKRSRKDKTSKNQSSVIEIAPTQMTLSMIGIAPTDIEVAQFMSALSNREMFTDVNLLFSEQATVQGHQVRRFRIEMNISQSLELSQIKTTRVARKLKQNPMGNTIAIDGQGQLIIPANNRQRP